MSDDNMITAPWTAEQVDQLNRFQQHNFVHPFTCPGHEGGGDRDLVATRGGWICRHCDYRQAWAHTMMLRKTVESPLKAMREVMQPTIEGLQARIVRLQAALRKKGPWLADPSKPRNAEEVIGGGYFVFRRGNGTGRIRPAQWPFEWPSLEKATAEADRLTAAQPGFAFEVMARVPEGYVLAPKVATPKMVAASIDAENYNFENTYKAMIAAAEPICPVCNGNDRNAPCCYPSEFPEGCLRTRT